METINEEELMELREWLNNSKNKSELESYIRDYHDLNLAMLKSNVDQAFLNVTNKIRKTEVSVKQLIPNWVKYAAAVVVIFGIGFLFRQNSFSSANQELLIPNENQITIELENGEIQTIDISQTKKVRDVNGNVVGAQNKNQISYTEVSNVEELVYNTINVPNGKKLQLELSDGTLVYLNAGSSLKYPIKFLNKGVREVFLQGEAYFDVAHNDVNLFHVNADRLDIKVLGTKFNVSAYSEDHNTDVVLVHGSVSLNQNNNKEKQSITLIPGQKGSYGGDFQGIKVEEVNTELYTSWMKGHLVFRNLSFNNILAKLERHYNIQIENSNKTLGKEIFNASFNDAKIDEVLSFFNDTHEINYVVENNKVIINP